MASLSPTYYISSSATPGTGDGTLGNPYALSDLSIVGGSYKTVNSGDVIGVVADGTYTLPADLNLVAGVSNSFTIFRGCKTDGTFDNTGATKAIFANNGFRLYTTNNYNVLADIDVQTVTGSTTTGFIGGQGTNNVFYNVHIDGSSATSGPGFYLNGTSSKAFRCSAQNMPGVGFWNPSFKNNAQVIYCHSSNNEIGFNLQGNYWVAVHCIAQEASGGSGSSFGFGMRGNGWLVVHCLADRSLDDGFRVDGNTFFGDIIACVSTNNGGYGYNIDIDLDIVTLTNCNAFGNTSGTINTNRHHIGSGVDDTTDPNYVGGTPYDYTAQTNLPTLEDFLLNVNTPSNMYGALTVLGNWGGGSGGSGGLPIFGGGVIRGGV